MLVLALGVLLAAAPPLTPGTLEERAVRHVLQDFERVGRRTPTPDAALTQAARRLARAALEDIPTGPIDLLSLTEAVSDAGGADPSPRVYVIRSSALEHAEGTLLARHDLSEEPASHLGVGVAVRGDRNALVVLLAQRTATLQPFPRALEEAGTGRTLCGQFEPTLRSADVYVTLPDGRVEHPALTREAGPAFCSRLLFATEGHYTVEILGRGAKGPEVAALFLVDVGGPRQRGALERLVEPTGLEASREAVLERINALRRAYGQPVLVPDDTLTQVAQAYSERMAREGFFGHVAPDGSDLRARMAAAGASGRTAGENLGLSTGPLSAHFGIEHSPGHRGNLLLPQYQRVGIGVALEEKEGRTQTVLTEVFSSGPAQEWPSAHPRDEAYQALEAHRAQRGLPPLVRHPVLERLAQETARYALEKDEPRAQPPGPSLSERVFADVGEARTVAVDVYVTESPSELPASRGVAERKNSRVGVGVVRGDSRTYGKGQYWMVVIYAATR